MRKFIPALFIVLILSGCTPIERTAYNTVVGAKAFLDSEKKQHPECATTPGSSVCTNIVKAVAAKDALIDAITVYCSGPDFNTGGACNPPAKGTPAATQATAKLKAAIDNYNQIASDLKGLK
jgi:hypothetical protein